MRSIAVVTGTASYDLINERASTANLERIFGTPDAAWDPESLKPGDSEAIEKVSIRKAETRTIEIDREDCVVWVTYVVVLEVEYDQALLEYYGSSIEDAARAACIVEFGADDRSLSFVSRDITVTVN